MGDAHTSPGSPALLLFPTELEVRRFEDQRGLPSGVALRAIAGFGPVAAAARTGSLLARLRPARCILIGIAGTFDEDAHPVGSARTFDEVAIDGIGVGEGDDHRGGPSLGFPQWPGRGVKRRTDPGHETSPGGAGEVAVDNRLPVAPLPRVATAPLLLTTCAASGSPDHADLRRRRFPDAAAEDMEGFGIALACHMQGTPFSIGRGMSNVVGERNPANWRIPLALAAARESLLASLLAPGGSR